HRAGERRLHVQGPAARAILLPLRVPSGHDEGHGHGRMTPREAGRAPARRSVGGGAVRALVPLVLLALVACTGKDAGSVVGVSQVSKPLPSVSGPSLHPDGGTISTGAYKGKVLVVNF